MVHVTMEQAQVGLPELIDKLAPGEEAIITRAGIPVAQVTRTPTTTAGCQAGCYKKAEFWISPDFDAPLEDFQEYME